MEVKVNSVQENMLRKFPPIAKLHPKVESV